MIRTKRAIWIGRACRVYIPNRVPGCIVLPRLVHTAVDWVKSDSRVGRSRSGGIGPLWQTPRSLVLVDRCSIAVTGVDRASFPL
jgi:hypothetical protein